jgi:hypothetical protein
VTHNTARLSIPVVDGVDQVNAYPTTDQSAKAILDTAATFQANTLVNLPSPGTVEAGRFFDATDKVTMQWSDGNFWYPVGLIPSVTVLNGVSVTSGQVLICTAAATTVTLPAPANGALLGILNIGVNGTTVNGTNINGIGLTNASSFPLGTRGSSAILTSNGTNWYIVAGGLDTGWKSLTLASGVVTVVGSETPSARLLGDLVYLKGEMQNATGVTLNAGSGQWATVPTSMKPTAANGVVMAGSAYVTATFAVPIVIDSTGAVFTASGSANNIANNGLLWLDGIRYSTS